MPIFHLSQFSLFIFTNSIIHFINFYCYRDISQQKFFLGRNIYIQIPIRIVTSSMSLVRKWIMPKHFRARKLLGFNEISFSNSSLSPPLPSLVVSRSMRRVWKARSVKARTTLFLFLRSTLLGLHHLHFRLPLYPPAASIHSMKHFSPFRASTRFDAPSLFSFAILQHYT